MSSATTNIESVLHEERVFPPPRSFAERAHIKSMEELEALRAEASADPEKFWARMAEELYWFKKCNAVLKWEPPHAQWFVGGKLNISYNCLDRHLGTWRHNKAALIWEGEPGDTRTLTYQQLHAEVCRFANVLKRMGVEQGDRVALYMPLKETPSVKGCIVVRRTGGKIRMESGRDHWWHELMQTVNANCSAAELDRKDRQSLPLSRLKAPAHRPTR